MKQICYALVFIVFLAACTCNNDGARSYDYQNMSLDSLTDIQDALDSTIAQKQPGRIDSIKALGALRDSLILVKGKISAGRLANKPGTVTYKQLDSAYFTIDSAIAAVDDILLHDIIETLRPTNAAFKTLIKAISDRKEALEKVAGKIALVADITKTITSILTAPLFSSFLPVSTPAAVP